MSIIWSYLNENYIFLFRFMKRFLYIFSCLVAQCINQNFRATIIVNIRMDRSKDANNQYSHRDRNTITIHRTNIMVEF